MKRVVLLLLAVPALAMTTFIHAEGLGWDNDSAISDAQRHLEMKCSWGTLSNIQVVALTFDGSFHHAEMTANCQQQGGN